MTPPRNRKRPFHFKDRASAYPEVKRLGEWPAGHREFYGEFYAWLKRGGYQEHTVARYGSAARVVLGLMDQPACQIAETDLACAWEHLAARPTCASVRGVYKNGLDKLAQYLAERRQQPPRATRRCRVANINWPYYLQSLPDWLAQDVRVYVAHCRKNWKPSEQHQRCLEVLSKLTLVLRSLCRAPVAALDSLTDITPNRWDDHLAARLDAGLSVVTLNTDLRHLQSFLQFLHEAGRPICQRMLRVKRLRQEAHVPRDVPPEQLSRLLGEVERAAQDPNPTTCSLAVMDRAWILLMLHSGLRSGEVRRLRLGDLDWERRFARIEQSKGLKDRLVPLSLAALDAVRAYLAERGRDTHIASDLVFIHWHLGLGLQYCQTRLRWYGARCGVKLSPHQLRHSAATLLLNAGAPVLTVQTILGHKQLDTTLSYARLYDGTVAADYFQAMAQVEQHLALTDGTPPEPPSTGELLALVDALRSGTLNRAQAETAQTLRAGLLAWAEQSGAWTKTELLVSPAA